MSESMIERVERALIDAMNGDPRGGSFSRGARAAIEAMREATDAMIEAGNLPGWDDSVTIGLSEEIWLAMIDAALNEHANAR